MHHASIHIYIITNRKITISLHIIYIKNQVILRLFDFFFVTLHRLCAHTHTGAMYATKAHTALYLKE